MCALAVIRLIAKMVLIRSRSLTTFTELTTYLPLFDIGEVLYVIRENLHIVDISSTYHLPTSFCQRS